MESFVKSLTNSSLTLRVEILERLNNCHSAARILLTNNLEQDRIYSIGTEYTLRYINRGDRRFIHKATHFIMNRGRGGSPYSRNPPNKMQWQDKKKYGNALSSPHARDCHRNIYEGGIKRGYLLSIFSRA